MSKSMWSRIAWVLVILISGFIILPLFTTFLGTLTGAGIFIHNSSLENCPKLTGYKKDNCYDQVSFGKQDASICNNIESNTLKSNCFGNAIGFTSSLDVCKNAPDAELCITAGANNFHVYAKNIDFCNIFLNPSPELLNVLASQDIEKFHDLYKELAKPEPENFVSSYRIGDPNLSIFEKQWQQECMRGYGK